MTDSSQSKFAAGDVIRERQRNAKPRKVTHVNDDGSLVTVPGEFTRGGRLTVIAVHRLGAFDLVERP